MVGLGFWMREAGFRIKERWTDGLPPSMIILVDDPRLFFLVSCLPSRKGWKMARKAERKGERKLLGAKPADDPAPRPIGAKEGRSPAIETATNY
jgi:hypothetical protein